MKQLPLWELHGSLTKDSYEARLQAGLPIRVSEMLKPTTTPIKSLEMTVKRSRWLNELMIMLLKEHSPEEVRADPMLMRWVQEDTERKNVPKRAEVLAAKIWGDRWWREPEVRVGWHIVFDLWWSGANKRGEEALMQNLPDSVREKL